MFLNTTESLKRLTIFRIKTFLFLTILYFRAALCKFMFVQHEDVLGHLTQLFYDCMLVIVKNRRPASVAQLVDQVCDDLKFQSMEPATAGTSGLYSKPIYDHK